MIEDRKTHKGFRDASRRNRIEEELNVLHDTVRRDQAALADAQQFDDGEHDVPSTTPRQRPTSA